MRATYTNASPSTDPRWWLAEHEPHESAYPVAMGLVEAGADRIKALRFFRALYVDKPEDEADDMVPAEDLPTSPDARDRASRKNIVASAIDTMHSKTIRNRPRPWIVTIGGDWKSWTRARLASLWIDGFFESAKVYEIGDLVALDAMQNGRGWAKIWEDDTSDLPQIERVWEGELWTDPREEAVGKLRTLYHVRGIDREVLAEAYPDHADEIRDDQDTATMEGLGGEPGAVDIVAVVECWRLPTGRGKHGRHVVCTATCTLYDEEWEDPDFPFVPMLWRQDTGSSAGIGLAEALAGTQLDINELEASICEGYRRMVACWLIPKGSMPPEQLNNAIGTTYTYDPAAGPPQFYNPPPVSGDLLGRSQSQVDSGFQLAGVSQLSAAMMKPAGLNSGIALQNYQDVESERHVYHGRSYERFYCEVAKRVLRCADRLLDRLRREKDEEKDDERDDEDDDEREHEEGSSRGIDKRTMTLYGGKRSLRAVEYSAASLRDQPHVVRVFPVSSLAQTPAARLQQVNDMWNMGLIEDRGSMLELLNFPDLDRYSERELSGHWEVDELIDYAIDGTAPEDLEVHSYMDHPYLRKRATQMRSVAKLRGAPDGVLDALSHLIDQADVWLAKATPPPAQAAPGMAAPPALPPDPTAAAAAPMGPTA